MYMKNNKMNILTQTEAEVFLTESIPSSITDIKQALNEFDLFLVGGSVRDAFFSKVPKDFDLATNAMPDEVMRLLQLHNIKCEPRGVEFGVVVASIGDLEFEIATFRSDISGNTGNLMDDSVKLGVTIQEDVKRRDLTINALFFDLNSYIIVDLVGGIDDIKNGIINTVGNPDDRFKDDSTRKLRVVRFASRYNFEIHNSVIDSIRKDPSLNCNNERIEAELTKIFDGSNSEGGLWIHKLNLTQEIFKDCNVQDLFYYSESNLSVFCSIILLDFEKDFDKIKNVIKNNVTLANIRLIKMFQTHTFRPLEVIRLMKSTDIQFEDIKYHIHYNYKIYFGNRIHDIIKDLNKQALEKGLSGKSISDYTNTNLSNIIKYSM